MSNNVDNEEALKIYRALESKFNELISLRLTPYPKRQSAIVISSDNANKTVIVKLPYSTDTEDQYMTLRNESGESLYKGNSVFIDSWGGDLTSAVVVMRNRGVVI